MHANDIGVAKLGGGPRLAEEQFGFFSIKSMLAGNLDRNDAIKFGVVSFPNAPKRADAEFSVQREMGDRTIYFASRSNGRQFSVFDQREVTATGRTVDIGQRLGVDHLDRIPAVGAADAHRRKLLFELLILSN